MTTRWSSTWRWWPYTEERAAADAFASCRSVRDVRLGCNHHGVQFWRSCFGIAQGRSCDAEEPAATDGPAAWAAVLRRRSDSATGEDVRPSTSGSAAVARLPPRRMPHLRVTACAFESPASFWFPRGWGWCLSRERVRRARTNHQQSTTERSGRIRRAGVREAGLPGRLCRRGWESTPHCRANSSTSCRPLESGTAAPRSGSAVADRERVDRWRVELPTG